MNLTTTEVKTFTLLREVAEEHGVTVRIAGGYIRDKLLNLNSNDIDVSVDIMSGKDFATLVSQHTGGKVSVIDANVEANKHLESAILKINGIEIDFVQLRSEVYNTDSRNPEIVCGVTPEEDARRRDLTINSLFFNIHTMKVEDYVGGLDDLNNRIAKTPINPLKTYLEDPLRILRAIRFAARFDLDIDPKMIEAARNEKVREALEKKVSRERVWSEMSKFMSSPNMSFAAELMNDFGLRDMFLAPNEGQLNRAEKASKGRKWTGVFDGWDKEQNNPYHNLNVWDHTIAALRWLDENIPSDNLIRNVSLLLHDVGKCDICSQQIHPEEGWSTYHEHEISSAYAADEVLRDLKAPNEIRERVVKLVRNHMRLHVLPENAKSGLRRVIRDIGDDWNNLVEMSKADSMGKVGVELDPKYDVFDTYAQEYMNNIGGSEVKPPINGHEVMQILGLKPGREVGIVMSSLKEELLENPEMSKDEAIELIKEIF